MRHPAKNITNGDRFMLALLLFFLGLLILSNLTGCASVEHSHARTPDHIKQLVPKRSHRCRTIGMERTENAAVLIQKNCVKNGVTTVATVVFNKAEGGRIAAEDAVKMIKRILGFAPVIKILVVGEDKNTPFMLGVITDVAVAAK